MNSSDASAMEGRGSGEGGAGEGQAKVNSSDASTMEGRDSGGQLACEGKDIYSELPCAHVDVPKIHDEEDMEVESFSFDSDGAEEEEESKEESQPVPVLSKAFNVEVLQAAIEASADALELVKGKDVVMVAGKTGVGKSTLMQGLAGKRLVAIEHEDLFSGDLVSKIVYDAEDGLPAFEIGHATQSKTNSINALLLGCGTVYLDSPGVEDTGGVEMDIATSSLLSQVAKRCKSLRFIILVHCASLIEDRGGAVRSVLKFARAFVPDFNKTKMSFMFMFTHSEEITAMSESPAAAEKHLLDEIIRTAKGTQDDDVLAVLDFIKQSLKKGYPFVQIFHPLKTDYNKVISFIQSKVKKVTDLTLAGTCNLTLSSKLKLEGACQILVQNIRVALSEPSKDLGNARDTQALIQYLDEYIDVACVHHAAAEAKELIAEHLEDLKASMTDIIAQGTTSQSEFNAVHVKLMRSILQQLDLGETTLHPSLEKLKENILEKVHTSQPFHHDLKNLSIWADPCEGFNSLAPLYANTCKKVNGYIQGLATDLLNADITNLDTMARSKVFTLVNQLYQVHSLCEQLSQFPLSNIDSEDVILAKESIVKKLDDSFNIWTSSAKHHFGNKIDTSEENIGIIAARIEVLESIQEAIHTDNLANFTAFKGMIAHAQKALEDEVTGNFYRRCEILKGGSFDLSWKPHLIWMQSVCERFSNTKRDTLKRMESALLSHIETVKLSLYKMAGELENMSQMTIKHGIKNGESLANEVILLESFAWVDELFFSSQRFVLECCGRVRAAIDQHIQTKHAELENLGSQLSLNTASNINIIGSLLPEYGQIDSYVDTAHQSRNDEYFFNSTSVSLASESAAHIERFISNLGCLAAKLITYWVTNILKSRIGYMRSIARKLNHILAIMKAVSNLDVSENATNGSRMICSLICDKFAKFKSIVQREFGTIEGDFGKKVAYLTCLKACSGYTHVELHLVKYRIVEQKVRDLVSKEAAKLETMISASSDWDNIDKRLRIFESGKVLDPFVRNEVSCRLLTLKHLRDQKEGQVEDLVQTMIQERNFKGIGEFLKPLSKSKDQVKRQAFQNYQGDIWHSLEGLINGVYRLLDVDTAVEDKSEQVSEIMGILEAAMHEIQDLPCMSNLVHELPRLKQRIDEVLRHFTNELREAIEEKDIVRMATIRRRASIYSSNMKKYVSPNNASVYAMASDKSKAVVEALPQCVDKFFKPPNFEGGDDLAKSLASLKQADELGSFPKLSEVYAATKQSILSKSQDTMELVRTIMRDAECIDDLIIYVNSLYRQLQGPLRDYLPSAVASECERLIARLHKEKKKRDKILDFGGEGYQQSIDQLAHRLDCLKSISRWRWLWRNESETYSRICNSLVKKVENRFSLAQVALSSRDLVSVQECVQFLDYVNKKANTHIEIVSGRVQAIRDLCVATFDQLCDRAMAILGSSNIIPFLEIFQDYRGFAINLPFVLSSPLSRTKFASVNQLLYESLSEVVSEVIKLAGADEFDSSSIRTQVQQARSWGSFCADRLTLLHEEMSLHTDATPDKWLSKIHDLCWKHFSDGRDLSAIKDCAILGVMPSANESEIKKAYRAKACTHRSAKSRRQSAAMIRKVHEAQENLLKMSHITRPSPTQPFDEILIGIGEQLRGKAQSFMLEGRYDLAEKLLFELPNLKVLDDLVEPNLSSSDTISSIYSLVKGHVEKVRVEVDSTWSARKYKHLNTIITDLKSMEQHFKAYPHIFPQSWDRGISRKIEAEIESLGQKAKDCLQSRSIAKKKQDDFRRCFVDMGFVLVELPMFSAFTKSVMSSVLEDSLSSDWGFGYLFELGLSLQKGDESSSDNENRIAQMIVSEFSHFKEVLTMVWNEEVSQKPAEDTVVHITGEHYVSPTQHGTLKIDSSHLLQSFATYEKEYKSLLGDYIKPDADLSILIHKTLANANQLQLHHGGVWGKETKEQIPTLLASVFAVFTVIKSGASYNRIEAASGSSDLGEKLLIRPHNIQVLTILYMLGCGQKEKSCLENLLMQIRTGEGKSMILGAAAIMLALLGYKVRTVCYSEYLSARDYQLFEECFKRFGLTEHIKYSKITTFAEDSTAAKGDMRSMTESLLRGKLSSTSIPVNPNKFQPQLQSSVRPNSSSITAGNQGSPGAQESRKLPILNISMDGNNVTANTAESQTKPTEGDPSQSSSPLLTPRAKPSQSLQAPSHHSSTVSTQSKRDLSAENGINSNAIARKKPKFNNSSSHSSPRPEILLVDEVDVFFGNDFYGQTYNQVVEFREPEIEEILKRIWNAWSHGNRRLKLQDIRSMPEYTRLLAKMSSFAFLVDNEISLMLDQVSKVDDVPYFFHPDEDKVGYKVMDSVSYDVTYGYATVFTYLKEQAKLKSNATLSKVLAMPVSCGQFSYANISPHRILGVSGTLQALGEYERTILLKYGLDKFIYVPSVYGASNFSFDKGGDGICFEKNESDFFHRIAAEITTATKAKRAVILFFQNQARLKKFTSSPTYRQLSRHKKLLTEDMNSADKGFVIKKAATASQITLSTAVFGRGTDFFCKDDAVQKSGGVHVIQTFLSEDIAEEVQIQGRTARQGKRGSYQMVLLETDLESDFGVPIGEKDKVSQRDRYDWIGKVRSQKHQKQCKVIEDSLALASERDNATHKYFDRLLLHDATAAAKEFEDLYHLIKKTPMPSSLSLDIAFAIDVTGSMGPYSKCIVATVRSLILGDSNILKKLEAKFPEIEFSLRVGCLPFRDIDDNQNQFQDQVWNNGSHFTDDAMGALSFVQSACQNMSGGHDIAEDLIGAIHQCTNGWSNTNDWASDIKCLMLFSDAPTHGLSSPPPSGPTNYDSYPTRLPSGIVIGDAISSLASRNIDLYFCSFDPNATSKTEETLSHLIANHPDNKSNDGIVRIPMIPKNQLMSQSASTNGQAKHIIFVLDESGSMKRDWNGVVKAYGEYIQKRKQSQSESDLVSVVQFDSRSRVTVQNKPLSQAPPKLPFSGGGTRFLPAAIEAAKVARGTPSSHTPTVVFMSDGGTGDAPAAAHEFSLLNGHMKQTTGKYLELHVIAFQGGADRAQLQQIASASPIGKVHASANTADLATVFINIATNHNVATLLESEISKRLSDAVSDKLSLEYFGG